MQTVGFVYFELPLRVVIVPCRSPFSILPSFLCEAVMADDTPEEYLKAVSKASRDTFGSNGFIRAATTPPVAPAKKGNSAALLAKFFSNIRGSELPRLLLPPKSFIHATHQQFISSRQNLLATKEKVAMALSKCRKRTRDAADFLSTNRESLPGIPGDLPRGSDSRQWRRWLQRTNLKTLRPTVSIFLALDVAETTALVHALGQFVLSEVNVDDEEEDEEAESEGEADNVGCSEPQDCFIPIGQQRALDLLQRIQGPANAGEWLFAALVAVDVPLAPSTEVLFQDLLRRLCTAVRELSAAKGFKPGISTEPPVWPAGGGDNSPFKTCADVRQRDMWALLTFVVVVGKFFRQASADHLDLSC